MKYSLSFPSDSDYILLNFCTPISYNLNFTLILYPHVVIGSNPNSELGISVSDRVVRGQLALFNSPMGICMG
jgi:hypothetical protein